jgi:hypothetical protein
MPSYGPYEVFVRVGDKQALPEYDVKSDRIVNGIPEVSCWIPSKSGQVRCLSHNSKRMLWFIRLLFQTFSVHFRNHHATRTATSWNLSVDGTPLKSRCIFAYNGPFASNSHKASIYKDHSHGRDRTLSFADLEPTGEHHRSRA